MKATTKYWFLEGFDLFKKLGMLNMMSICKVLEMENFDKGKPIELKYEQENSIFFLKRGSVKIIDYSSNTVKYIIKRGNIFGDLTLFDKETAIEEVAYALEDCVICYIKSEQMEGLMEKHKSLKNGMLKIYGLRIKKLERRLNDLLFKDSSTRIKEFILDYIEEFGETDKSGKSTAQNLLTHKDIANLTNTSRQTVSNILSKMRKEKIIDYDAKIISKIS